MTEDRAITKHSHDRAIRNSHSANSINLPPDVTYKNTFYILICYSDVSVKIHMKKSHSITENGEFVLGKK